jgi:hypothetical protein
VNTFAPPPGEYRPVPEIRSEQSNGFAITSLVCGIFWPFCVTAILAIIFGHLALRQIRNAQGWQRGRGQALAGLWLGYLGVATLIVSVIVTSTR